MQPILATVFNGRVPRVAEKLLPDGFAQIATNCDLRRGKLQALNGLSTIRATSADTRSLIRINRDRAVTHQYAWLSSTLEGARFVRAQIADSDNRIYATGVGQGMPVQINSTLYESGPTWKRLGVVAPTVALSIAVTGSPAYDETEVAEIENCTTTASSSYIALHGAVAVDVGDTLDITYSPTAADIGRYTVVSFTDAQGSCTVQIDQELVGTNIGNVTVKITRQEDAAVADTVSYVYTRVIKWSDGSEQESAPSPPTGVQDIYTGQGITLSGFIKGSYNDVTHFRVYRLASGTSGAEYQYLDEFASTYSTYSDDIYAGVGTPNGLLDVQDDILETEDWSPPPDDLEGLIQFANGILAGFVGNKLYICEPYVAYAWPEKYTMTFDYDIVALAVYNESLIVLTEAFPYIVTGLDPQSMSQTILPYEQSCVSAGSVVATNIGVIYASPDGLFLLSGSEGRLLTKNIYTKDQWAALGPEDLISFFYDDQYLGFFKSSGTGIFLNFKEEPYIVDISISGGSITAGFIDPEDDTLYLVDGSNLKAWGAGSALTFTWKSKIYRPGDASNYACAAVVADGSVTFKVYADGTLKHTQAVSGGEMFRLPGGYRAREFEFSIEGAVDVDSVAIGQFPGELF